MIAHRSGRVNLPKIHPNVDLSLLQDVSSSMRHPVERVARIAAHISCSAETGLLPTQYFYYLCQDDNKLTAGAIILLVPRTRRPDPVIGAPCPPHPHKPSRAL